MLSEIEIKLLFLFSLLSLTHTQEDIYFLMYSNHLPIHLLATCWILCFSTNFMDFFNY